MSEPKTPAEQDEEDWNNAKDEGSRDRGKPSPDESRQKPKEEDKK